MAAITVNEEIDVHIPGMKLYKMTTTGASSTFVAPFAEIVAGFATNTSDDDGVAVSWSGATVTIQVATSGDVIYLMLWGRK